MRAKVLGIENLFSFLSNEGSTVSDWFTEKFSACPKFEKLWLRILKCSERLANLGPLNWLLFSEEDQLSDGFINWGIKKIRIIKIC